MNRSSCGKTGVRSLSLAAALLAATVLAACGSGGRTGASRSSGAPAPASADPVFLPARSRGELPPVTAPRLPEKIPDYAQYDPDSGLHVTGTYVELDIKTWRLAVTGAVRRPLSLDFDDLRTLPRVRSRSTLVCPGYFEDNAVWTGASLAALLDLAGPLEDAKGVNLVGADGYSAWIGMEDVRAPQNFLAYEFAEGRPVPVLHGFPVRAVFPSLTGSKWVKWLTEVQVEYADPPRTPPAGSVPGS